MIRKILCFIFLFFSLHSLSAEESMIQRLSQKKDQNLNPPAVSIHTLKNGMKVYWLEDDELPIFEMQVFIKGGTRLDPPALSGAASMMGALLRTGGTQKFSTVEIDRLLDNKGAEIETGMGFEYATAKLACLSEDQNELVPLLFEMLAEPRFAEGQIDLVRAQKIEALARLRDDPEKLASKKFPELVFGEGSIYSKTPSEQSLKKVQKNDLIQIHQMMFHPSQMIVAVSGKFKKDALFSLLEKSTQKMSQVKTPLPDLPAVEKKIENGFFGMDKKGVQSTLLIGHFGDQRFNPDKFAIILMNYLLGGDIFSS
ncbi:MAG: insulinase family protein, partial [Deltaproteobacteria bacterium]|nr:insulinase family protein [Deltaproteobacteria bacterium]